MNPNKTLSFLWLLKSHFAKAQLVKSHFRNHVPAGELCGHPLLLVSFLLLEGKQRRGYKLEKEGSLAI